MARIFQLPKQVPIVGGVTSPEAKANFHLTGTTTNTNTYTDAALTVPHTNPVLADAAGVFPVIFLDPDIIYRLILNDKDDALIYDEDPIQDALTQANIGKIFYPISAEETSAGVTPVNFFEIYGNIKRYGAVVDGATDDYAAINSALTAFDTIYFPEGTTVTGTTITLTASQDLIGVGWRSTNLTAGAGLTTTLIIIDDRCNIKDMQINGTGTKGTTNGIKSASTAARWRISNVTVNNFVNGLNLQEVWIGYIDKVLIQSCTDGIYVNNADGFNGPVNAITILGGEIASCSQAGIHFDNGGGAAFSVNTFNVYGMAIEPSGTYGVWNENIGISTLKFDGVYFEDCGSACYQGDESVQNLQFNNCLIDIDTAPTDKGIDITNGTSQTLILMNNEFELMGGSAATEAIDLGSGATVANTVMIGNAWPEAQLLFVNDAGSDVTAIGDERLGTRLVLPAIRDARENVTTTNVITAEETGKTFYLSAVGGFTSTLPAPASGLNYKFIVRTAPTTAYIITTNSGDNILHGTFLDIVGELTPFASQDTLNFVASTSIIGDRLEVESDGSLWYCKAISGVDGGITVAVT